MEEEDLEEEDWELCVWEGRGERKEEDEAVGGVQPKQMERLPQDAPRVL